jgi:adenosylmethionine-8-amino-7-oxononanoate aminotransferase
MANAAHTIFAPPALPKVSHGEGCYVFDSDGKQYIDGSGGPAVFSLGHAHPEVNEAIKIQLERIAHGYRYTFTSDPLLELSERIQSQVGPGFENILYVSSGSEAMESALKVALQFHWNNGDRCRSRFIARERSYHGNTLGALSISGFAKRRKQFENSLIPCTFVSAANTYRPAVAGDEDALSQFLADELEQEILRQGAENIAAFVFEPVVGAAGGVIPAPDGYAKKIREVCDRYGVLLIADEVMCGSGRCGTWRALEHDDNVVADIMTIAKGLGGGYVPLGAVLYSDRISKPILDADGAPNTGHTFTGHTLACAAAAKVQEIVQRDQLLDRVRTQGPLLMTMLQDALGGIEAVGDIRGRGHFVGIELVSDRESRQPFDSELKLTDLLRAKSLDAGLICYHVDGIVDGSSGDAVIVAPPYIAGIAEFEEITEKLAASLKHVLNDIHSARSST